MKPWTLEAIALHRFRSPGPEVLFQRGFGEMIDMIIYAFVLRSGAATVLLDTGLPTDHAALNDNIRQRKGASAGFFPAGGSLTAELAKRDLAPTHVAVTSFGPYAVGGLPGLSPIPLFASARGVANLTEPEEPALVHSVSDANVLARAEVVTGEAEILPGLLFIETGIHHPASAAIVADTTEGAIAIADPVFVARNLTDGLALGAAECAAGWHSMVRLLGRRADAMVPIHDPAPVPVRRADWHPLLRTDK